jgi:hypothetical protein
MMMVMIMVPRIVDMVFMMMVYRIWFQMMVDYWFYVLMMVVHWVRSVVMVMYDTGGMMVVMVDCHRMVMMVTRMTIMNAWWMPVFDMLVNFVVRYGCLLLTIMAGTFVATSIPASKVMVWGIGVNWVTDMAMREVWVIMVDVMVVHWPVMVVEMCLRYIVMVLVMQKYMLRTMVLMVDNCNTVRLTVRWTVWWLACTTVLWTISMAGYVAVMSNHMAVTIHTSNMTMSWYSKIMDMNGILLL